MFLCPIVHKIKLLFSSKYLLVKYFTSVGEENFIASKGTKKRYRHQKDRCDLHIKHGNDLDQRVCQTQKTLVVGFKMCKA
jgi:hypothetical protein